MKTLQIEILKNAGFTPVSDLNYCLDNGIEYYIGYYKKSAAIVALIEDENVYMIDKVGLREMTESAKTAGINDVWLYTNYGLEICTLYENPSIVGLNHIVKVNSNGKPF